MKRFELISNYTPKGDQPSAIKDLVENINEYAEIKIKEKRKREKLKSVFEALSNIPMVCGNCKNAYVYAISTSEAKVVWVCQLIPDDEDNECCRIGTCSKWEKV